MATPKHPTAAPHHVTTTHLRVFPGWVIKHNHTTGSYWAMDVSPGGVAISAGHTTFNGALQFVRNGGEER